jgi:hypothetical protein
VRNESITSLRQGIVDAPLKNHLGGVLLEIACHLSKIAKTLADKRKIINVEFIHSLACSYCGVTASSLCFDKPPRPSQEHGEEANRTETAPDKFWIIEYNIFVLNSSNRFN